MEPAGRSNQKRSLTEDENSQERKRRSYQGKDEPQGATPFPQNGLDVVSSLTQRTSAQHLLELEWKSLKNATLVNRSWYNALDNESFWQDMLYKRARRDGTWRHFLKRILDRLANPLDAGSSTTADNIGESSRDQMVLLKQSLQRHLNGLNPQQARRRETTPSMRQIYYKVASETERFTGFWATTNLNSTLSERTVRLNSAPHESGIKSVLHFASRHRFVVGYHGGGVRCYDEASLAVKEHFHAAGERVTPIFCLASFRRLLITGDGKGSIVFWDISDDEEARTPQPAIEFRHDVGPVCFLKVRNDHLIASSYSGLIAVWRLDAGISSVGVAAHPIFSGNVGYWEMDVDVDRHYVASAASDGLRLWRLDGGRESLAQHIVDGNFYDLAVLLLPDRDFLIVAADGGILKLLRKSTGGLVARFQDACRRHFDQLKTVIKLDCLENLLIVTYAEGWSQFWDVDRLVDDCQRQAVAGGDPEKVFSIPSKSLFSLGATAVDYARNGIIYSIIDVTAQDVYVIRDAVNERGT